LYFSDSPYSKPAEDGEQCTERTDESAVKSRDNQIEQNRRREYHKYQPRPFIKTRSYRNKVNGSVSNWQ
jgi:hypothetical protein